VKLRSLADLVARPAIKSSATPSVNPNLFCDNNQLLKVAALVGGAGSPPESPAPDLGTPSPDTPSARFVLVAYKKIPALDAGVFFMRLPI
jgi:hypothetical protein